MACDVGPITPSAGSSFFQAEINMQMEGEGVQKPALILRQDGTCAIDLPRLRAFAKMPMDQLYPQGAAMARLALALIGEPVAATAEEMLPFLEFTKAPRSR